MALRASDNGWKVDVSDTDVLRAEARLKAVPEKTRDWIEKTLKAAARAGTTAMLTEAPKGPKSRLTGDRLSPETIRSEARMSLRARLLKNYNTEIIKQTGGNIGAGFVPGNVSRYLPGGAGGGGSYTITFGPEPLPEFVADPTHDPAFILRVGAGMKGDPGAPGKKAFGFIRPQTGNVFAFTGTWKDDIANPQYTRGFKPRDAWFNAGLKAAQAVIRGRTQALDL